MGLLGLLLFFLILGLAAAVIIPALWQTLWQSLSPSGIREYQRERQQREARVAQRGPRLELNGWRYDGTHRDNSHYRVHGTTPGGLPWVVEYLYNHVGSSRAFLHFRIDTLAGKEHEWMIMNRRSFDNMRNGAAASILGGLATISGAFSKRFAGQIEFCLQAGERPAGSPALRKSFVLIAKSARYDRLLATEIEARLLTWPDVEFTKGTYDDWLSAGLGPDGLEVKLYVKDPNVEVIEQLVRLGEALADGSRRPHGVLWSASATF